VVDMKFELPDLTHEQVEETKRVYEFYRSLDDTLGYLTHTDYTEWLLMARIYKAWNQKQDEEVEG